jgi:hypothetical protein
MAFLVLSEAEVSPPAMTILKWILYGIELCLTVVGGENSIQRPWADSCRLALGETHPWYPVSRRREFHLRPFLLRCV